jgi:hypothetical protein
MSLSKTISRYKDQGEETEYRRFQALIEQVIAWIHFMGSVHVDEDLIESAMTMPKSVLTFSNEAKMITNTKFQINYTKKGSSYRVTQMSAKSNHILGISFASSDKNCDQIEVVKWEF